MDYEKGQGDTEYHQSPGNVREGLIDDVLHDLDLASAYGLWRDSVHNMFLEWLDECQNEAERDAITIAYDKWKNRKQG